MATPATPRQLPWSRTLVAPAAAALALPPSGPAADKRFSSEMKALRSSLGTPPAALCAIDMSGPGPIAVAGWEMDRPMQIASMAKLALLVAACQLRDDVQAVVEWAGVRRWRDVVPRLTGAWRKGRAPEFKALAGRGPDALPEFDRIFDAERFDAGADAVPQFRSMWPNVATQGRLNAAQVATLVRLHLARRPVAPDPALEKRDAAAYQRLKNRYVKDFAEFYDGVLGPVAFSELLRLTVKWSDNEAASACLSLLGLPYVGAVLRQLGLFDARSRRGLWLGGPYRPLYGSTMFRSPGTPEAQPVAARAGTSEGDEEKTPVSTQAGTARACATLMAALVQGILAPRSAALARDMLEFRLNDVLARNVPENFYLFRDEMVAARVGQTQMMLSKIGILGPLYSDCAHLLFIPAPPSGGPEPPDAEEARMSGRSLVVCALQAPSGDVLAAAGAGVLAASQKLAG